MSGFSVSSNAAGGAEDTPPIYDVKNHDADLYKFNDELFFYHETNFQVYAEFIDSNHYAVVVRRIDADDRWDEDINVLVHNKAEDVADIVHVGSSPVSEKRVSVTTNYEIFRGDPVRIIPRYTLKGINDPKAVSRDEFNTLFGSDIVVLPSGLYAVGLKDGEFYIYNEAYNHFYNIIYSIKFIMRVAISMTEHRNFYFIASACDGYMELNYWSPARTVPKYVGAEECKGMFVYKDLADNEYPVYHSKKYILGQSNHANMPFVLDIIDRHYLYHNYYNPFRSYHQGIPFQMKENKVVFAAQDRGHVENDPNDRYEAARLFQAGYRA
jgi:hypothetical protein